ncbi:hypothetical protein [uncultured Thiodictyon sp.]|uniref:hypothetical protein n=1 Tax=uncultured Thiodictyon sp. TaxID=1846217 RepID=UPI0025EA6CD2|nr:hypothetical protein [uncultured Thiodictyon sp.]
MDEGDGARPTVQAIDLVLFRWGTLHLALQACQVLALESAGDAGLPSIGDVLALPVTGPAPGALRLHVIGPTGRLRIQVQGPVTQVRLPAAAIHPLPPLLAARLRLPWVRALGLDPCSGPKETGGRGFSRSTLHLRDPGPAKASTSSAVGISAAGNDDQVRRLILILDPRRGIRPGSLTIET